MELGKPEEIIEVEKAPAVPDFVPQEAPEAVPA